MEELRELLKRHGIPGFGISVINNNEIDYVFEGTKDGKVEIDATTLFSACSISKLITAVLILKACDEALITLEDDVNKHFKHFTLKGSDDSYRVTIEDLLINESGICDGRYDFDVYDEKEGKFDINALIKGESCYIEDRLHIQKAPRTEFIYSDSNYLLLEKLLEDVYNKTYRELAQEKIFGPLGMVNTKYIDFEQLETENLALGHNTERKLVNLPQNIYPYDSVAGLWTTAFDLGLLIKQLLNAYNGQIDQVIDVETARSMFTAHGSSVSGYGVFSYLVRGKKAFSTQGWGAGFQCYMFGFPDDGESIIVMMNLNPNVEQLEGPIGEVINHYIDTRINKTR